MKTIILLLLLTVNSFAYEQKIINDGDKEYIVTQYEDINEYTKYLDRQEKINQYSKLALKAGLLSLGVFCLSEKTTSSILAGGVIIFASFTIEF